MRTTEIFATNWVKPSCLHVACIEAGKLVCILDASNTLCAAAIALQYVNNGVASAIELNRVLEK